MAALSWMSGAWLRDPAAVLLPCLTLRAPPIPAALSRLRKVGSQGSLDNVCCFCQQPGDESVPGGLASLHATKPGSRASTPGSLKYHEPCVGYSNSSLELQHAIDRRAQRGDRRLLLDADVARVWHDCRAYVCAVCGKLGATVACCAGAEECSAWFHFPCARMAAQEGKRGIRVTFDQNKRELACAAHAFRYVQDLPT
jgi:hypothetical protein